jgi:hypothetical protein
MNQKEAPGISRREFARRAALASAMATLDPAKVLDAAAPVAPPQDEQVAKLSPESQAEVEARIDAITRQYGKRLSKEQQTDIRRLCVLAQPPLDRLRTYAKDNGDSPALYLKPLVERDKKPAPQTRAVKSSTSR